ncbi:murein biosynthesis integral membrane protein MurJ [Candidatus Erwinia haradaeae]|uniref:Probable lipid II flippase MurJ n=1 Tax=Candidatus Erwinia haradaeae TaxID=1922217 RepID=A0A451D1V6_9GAMM|nr:murein biosynthesis integral membrane protein MurJ [Candidatus Erwinia haradaeae]VFP79613.1 Lipid II flippase MurJ [Candidatus Erwinia haradaeae]
MNLLKSLIAVGLVTVFSRVLGFVRDMIIACMFGAGMVTDSFFVAFKLPNLLRRIFAEGAFSQAFVPLLSEHKSMQNIALTKIFLAKVSGLLTFALILVTGIGILTTPWVVLITAPGFSNTSDQFALTMSLLRIMFPYILFISLTAFFGAILNTWNYFIVPAFAPILLNISIIVFSLFTAPYFHPPVIALAWGVICGGILQFIYQLPFLKKLGLLVLPCFNICDKSIWRLISQMSSAIISVSLNQLSMIFNTVLASFLEIGSVSWMYYADRLMEFPTGVLGVTLSTILLPSLSKTLVSGQNEEYSCLIDWGLRLCLLLAIPSAIALGILAKPLIIVLFQYGKFNAFDVAMTQRSLLAYSIGLVGLILVKVLAPGFYARQDMKTPLKIAICTLLATQVMNLAFISSLKHAGLSLSIGLSACLNTGLLYWQIRKKHFFQPQPGWRIFFIRVFFSVLVMGASLVGILNISPDWTLGGMPERIFRLIAVLISGISVYGVMLFIVGFRSCDFSRLTQVH